MAAIPAGIEACLNPIVLENTKTLGSPFLFFEQLARASKAQRLITISFFIKSVVYL